MKRTIDSARWLAVPNALRQVLEFHPGQVLEVHAGDRRLEVEITATPMMLKRRGKGVVAVPGESLPPLTAEKVRETMERERR